ncbi:MAG TPA: IS701 family transposase [Streptosporangiaceae bacterium]|nr:IS701 family transposase [Streptosporangiaceae bacterium]
MRQQDREMAVWDMAEDKAWPGKLHGELCALIAPVLAQARSRFAAFAYVAALLEAPGDRRSCWQLGEQAGHATARRMQALLAGYAWDWRAVLERLQRFILAHLAGPAAILVLDETAELKKGTMTAGVSRQHAGITGQIENCQTVVFLAYVTARARTLFNFRLYLPGQWCQDTARRGRARVPGGTVLATRTEQGTAMITDAVTASVPFGRVAGDEVYGRSSRLRAACEDAGKGCVLAVPVNHQVRTPAGRKATVAALARLVPARCWETRTCGHGRKGHRDYPRAMIATSSPRHWALVRRKISDPADLAFFYAHAPGLVSLSILVKVAGKRWPVEECFQQGKGQAGLDQHQLRLWPSFHRHTVLSMCALALLAVATARPPGTPIPRAPPRPGTTTPPQTGTGTGTTDQPQHWRDTGKLPVRPGEQPPRDTGLIRVTVPEARRLLAATAHQTFRYAWSIWRRRHQARARWHHYQAQLQATPA